MSKTHVVVTKEPEKKGTSFKVFIDDDDAISYGRSLSGIVMELVAKRYVEENYQEIVKNIDQKAIATLAVANAAATINKTLDEKIPNTILEIVRKK